MFVAIYCWRIKPGMEDQFREGWRQVAEALHSLEGGLGSRLHRNFDGTWLAYAQWSDRKHWEKAEKAGLGGAEDALQMMRESVENPDQLDRPVFRLVVTDDFLHAASGSIEMRPPA